MEVKPLNTALFFVSLIVFIFSSICFYWKISDKSVSEKKKYLRIVHILSLLILLLGVSDLFGIVDHGIYSGAYVFMSFVQIVMALLCFANSKKKDGIFRFAAKVVLIASVLELTMFNIPAYRHWFGSVQETSLSFSEARVEGGGYYREAENDFVAENGEEIVIAFDGVDQPVSSVYAEVGFDNNTPETKFILDAKDETQVSIYRYNIAETNIIDGIPESQYLQCELSGNVSDLRVKFTPQNNGKVYIRSVTLNSPIPMEISWVRFLLIVLICSYIYAVFNTAVFQKSFSEAKSFIRSASVIVTASACIIAFLVVYYHFDSDYWKEQWKLEKGNQVTQELVDAFEAHQVSLLEEPSEALIGFSDPYDRQYREASGVSCSWDHVYYEGKYYSYYGIAPVVLVFLPYHKLTGHYFPDAPAVLIFSMIGIIGLTFLFNAFVKKLFPKIPVGMFTSTLIILQILSGIWFSLGRPSFYEIAIASGFACNTWATYFLFTANIIGREKISVPRTLVSSLLYAIAVLCRPTLVLYCICAAAFMLAAVPRASQTVDADKKKLINKHSVIYLAAALLPMVCIGLVQMWYNNARFGSPFEFGIQYSLTINNFTKTQFHWKLSEIGIFNFLFNPPSFVPDYPFIKTDFQYMKANGFFYGDNLATHNTSGLFFLALPMFFYFLSGRALRHLPDRKSKLKSFAYIFFPCVLIPFVIVASVWESGYSARYMADFSWHAIFGALCIFYFLYLKTKNETVRKFMQIFLCFSLVWAIFVGGVQSLNQAFRYAEYHYEYPKFAYMVTKFFAFWR